MNNVSYIPQKVDMSQLGFKIGKHPLVKELLKEYKQLETIIKKQAFGDRLSANELNAFRRIINE
mgnify:CR=1 FL=1